jgi:hypothetical protein
LFPIAYRTNLPYHIPALALSAEVANPGYAFIFMGTATLNGTDVVHIQSRDDSDLVGHRFTVQDWYFDPTSALPVAVTYATPVSQNPGESLHQTMEYSNYKIVNGILVPFQLNVSSVAFSLVITLTSVVFNTNLNTSTFAPSTGSAQ